jgi:hypothetical protein
VRLGVFFLLFCQITQGVNRYFAFTTDYPSSYSIQGFQWHSRFEYFRLFDGGGKKHVVEDSGNTYEVQWNAERMRFSITQAEKVLASIGLEHLIQRAQAYQEAHPRVPVPQKVLTEEHESPQGKLRLYVEALSAERDAGGKPQILHLKADVFFRTSAK